MSNIITSNIVSFDYNYKQISAHKNVVKRYKGKN